MSISNLIFGRPVATSESRKEELSFWTGVPVLGLDALASTGYGPEAALRVLSVMGATGLHYYFAIVILIVAELGTLYFSYRQTAEAYPNGGGAYNVAKDNFGSHAALWAAVALLLDYTLNVAVGISAGIGVVVSAIPSLQPRTLLLCLLGCSPAIKTCFPNCSQRWRDEMPFIMSLSRVSSSYSLSQPRRALPTFPACADFWPRIASCLPPLPAVAAASFSLTES